VPTTSSRKSKFRPWDVVLVPFPYTDQPRTKLRPAVVVSSARLSDATGMYYVAMITNAAHVPWAGDVRVSDVVAAGLPIPSVVRTAKIATIDEQALIRPLGSLPKLDSSRVSAACRSFLAFLGDVGG
jgi:mRNA interferase MazF